MKTQAVRFAGAVAAMALCWGMLLPWMSNIPSLREYIDRQRSAGINPSSLYYTEHPAASEWEASIRDRISRDEALFW